MSKKNVWVELSKTRYAVMDAYAFLNWPSIFVGTFPCVYCPLSGNCKGSGSSDCESVRLQAEEFVEGLGEW